MAAPCSAACSLHTSIHFFRPSATPRTGNPTKIMIAAQSSSIAPLYNFTQTHSYDALNRILGANDTGGWGENYNYDRYGNMWLPTASDINQQPLMPQFQSAYDANTNRRTGTLAAYDPAGNQILLGGLQIDYDAENRQTSVRDSLSYIITSFAYDGLGQRVMKTLSTGTGDTVTVFVYDAFGNSPRSIVRRLPREPRARPVI